MFELSFTRDRWLIVAYGCGLILVLTFCLAYLSMKRPRRPELYQSAESPFVLYRDGIHRGRRFIR